MLQHIYLGSERKMESSKNVEIVTGTLWHSYSPEQLKKSSKGHFPLPVWWQTYSVVMQSFCWRSRFNIYKLDQNDVLQHPCLNIVHIILLIVLAYWSTERPSLWSRGQSSWLQIQRSGLDSRRQQIFWEVVGLERGPSAPWVQSRS
jgi:hypothetical protein